MPDLDLPALRALVQQMTPEGWTLDHDDTFVCSPLADSDTCTPGWIVELPEEFERVEPACALEQWKANCRGIVALRNAAPALLDAAERLEQMETWLKNEIVEWSAVLKGLDDETFRCRIGGRISQVKETLSRLSGNVPLPRMNNSVPAREETPHE